MSEETKLLMTERDKAVSRARLSKHQEDWRTANVLKNRCTNLLRTEKSRHLRTKLISCEEEKHIGGIWKNIKGYLGWGSSTGAPTQLTDPLTGQITNSPKKMADIQNQYYKDKVRKIREKLPKRGDPTAGLQKLMDEGPKPKTEGLILKSVNPFQVNKIIQELKNSKSCGLDNIDTFIIKLIRPYIVPAITHIVNTSIRTNQFPNSYKIAKVVPLHKGKEAPLSQPKSYRPISILPVISKIIERVIQIQMTIYMDKNQLFHPNHHAYRSLHSTTTAMLSMQDAWIEAAEQGLHIGVIMIDMSAAFDVVDLDLLLKKCEILNFNNETVRWLKSYLTQRQQTVYIGGHLSSIVTLEAGVPQGSILGPLLYTLYTLDFPEVVHEENCPYKCEDQQIKFRTICTECGGICCYADDSTYIVGAKTIEDLSVKLENKFKLMSSYLTENRLCINSDKTHLMNMSTRQKRRKANHIQLTLNTGNEIITTSRKETLLGFKLHENMGFSEHILDNKDSLVKTLSKRIGALKKIRKVASFKAKLNIANGIIMSKILYLLPLYSGCPEYLLKSIQTKQNEAMRQITGKRWVIPGREYVSTAVLLKECGWLSIKQLSFYTTVLCVQKTLLNQSPKLLYEKITSGVRHNTRGAVKNQVERTNVEEARLQLASSSYRWRGHLQHSRLPNSLKDEQDISVFKSKVKCWVRQNVPI